MIKVGTVRVGMYTREGGGIPLRGVEVDAEVVGAHARVKLRQRYRNDEPRPVEAIYTFPLPADATLTGFAMTSDGRRVEGEVREREAAFRAYDDAVVSGHGAALLEQERSNVFTASVGNLLPGEDTVVELEYVQRVTADEGALRWMLPTLVAPRYIPGAATGDRTAHGEAQPTDRVPDADRISPRAGAVGYGLKLELLFDVGRDVEVESPSHALTVVREGRRVRVSFAQREVALDRDVVVTARGVGEGVLTAVATHRAAGADGTLALTVVPDLFQAARSGAARQDVVFLIDTSGSMEGASITEARAALRLCLRHLREGDRFNVVEFNSVHRAFAPGMVGFTQANLEGADAWVSSLAARGGTELLGALTAAVELARDGVVVLLTDGQVGNEDQILQRVLATRGRARVYSFGIGTNVSDALLRDLARETGAAVEFIHPGERIDEKVVAQFARAVAPRVTGVSVRFEGADVGEIAPGTVPDLIDGEPWALYGRYARGGGGRAVVSGTLGSKPWSLEVPLDLPDEVSRPVVAKLWAAERVRDLEGSAARSGRSADAMRARIVALAVEHGIASRYTSFVVVEKRTGDRRTAGQPEARPIPVNLPAGWAMFEPKRNADDAFGSFSGGGSMSKRMRFSDPGGPPPPAPQRAAAPVASAAPTGLVPGAFFDRAMDAMGAVLGRAAPPPPQSPPQSSSRSAAPMRPAPAAAPSQSPQSAPPAQSAPSAQPGAEHAAGVAGDPVVALLGRQLASGLWDGGAGVGTPSDPVRRVRATTRALVELLRAGVTTSHPLHGAQVRKAVEALVPLAVTVAATDPAAAEAALAAAWLVATGRRTRGEVAAAASGVPVLTALSGRFADEHTLREWLDKTVV